MDQEAGYVQAGGHTLPLSQRQSAISKLASTADHTSVCDLRAQVMVVNSTSNLPRTLAAAEADGWLVLGELLDASPAGIITEGMV